MLPARSGEARAKSKVGVRWHRELRRRPQDSSRRNKAPGRGDSAPHGAQIGEDGVWVVRQTVPVARVSTSLQTVVNRMKPYTTIEQISDGMRYLPLQLKGVQLDALPALIRGRRLLACRIPQVQAARSASQVILNFDPDISLELTSSSTVAQGWDEFGTINVELLPDAAVESTCEWSDLELTEDLAVVRTEIVRWQGDGLIVDSGISLHFGNGRTFSAVALNVPAALLLTMPGENAPDAWQFPADEYSFVVIG